MQIIKLFISFCLIVGCFSAFAVEGLVNLWTWKPGPDYPTYILPAPVQDSYEKVIHDYLMQVGSGDLADDIPVEEWKNIKVIPLATPQSYLWQRAAEPRVLLVANGLRDHLPGVARLNQFITPFKKYGIESFVLPVGATARFNRQERKSIHIMLGKYFRTIKLLGGNDLTPNFYRKKVKYAIKFNPELDSLEIELIKDVYEFTEAKIVGTCRGMQVVCVALGCSLYQDMHKQLKITEIHRGGEAGIGVEHPVQLLPTSSGLGEKLFNQLESWFISDHHQSVIVPKNSIFEVAAVSSQGIVEAVVSRDQRIVLIQAHAERQDSKGAGEIFYSRLTEWMKIPLCEQLLY